MFIITPRSNQVELKAVGEKDGMVIVRIKVKDEELFEYSLYDDDDEIYFGYVTATGGSAYYYFDGDKDGVKEKMGW